MARNRPLKFSLRSGSIKELLAIAWRWVKSNSEANFKAYCRERYSVFELGSSALLHELGEQLLASRYVPEGPEKIFVRKPAGMLRPLTVLTVRDQIVYQALAIPIAEALYRKVFSRYGETTFGHQYSGSRNSLFFYNNWRNGYRAYNMASRNAHRAGYRYLVTFDLTACYDSIDHTLLLDEIRELGADDQFRELLGECLRCWTQVPTRDRRKSPRRHGHGIPQGPLSSGILSEVVLQHFDEAFLTRAGKRRFPDVRFLRYVDDIRIFGRSYEAVDKALRVLDRTCKELGMFPQKAKQQHLESAIDAAALEQSLKSISNPPEEFDESWRVNQVRLRQRLHRDLAMMPEEVEKGREPVQSPTRLKYLLGKAEPDKELAEACIQFLGKPGGMGYLPNVVRYLMRHQAMTAGQCEAFVATMAKHAGYESILANMLDVLALQPPDVRNARVVRDVLTKAGLGTRATRVNLQADLAFAFMRWQIAVGIGEQAIKSGISSSRRSWLGTARVIDLFHALQHEPSVKAFVESRLCSEVSDVALSAAWWCVQCGSDDLLSAARVSPMVKVWLRGPVLAVDRSVSAHAVLKHIIRVVPEIDWGRLVGENYGQFALHLRAAAACWDTEVGRALDSWRAALRILEEGAGVMELGLAGKVRAVREQVPERMADGRLRFAQAVRPIGSYAERERLLVELSSLFDQVIDHARTEGKLEVSHV